MTSLEEFLCKLKMHFVVKVVYTIAQKDLIVHREDPELPPVIAPVLRGSVVTNTEHLKKSVSLKCYYDQIWNLFLITYFENICKSDLPCQVWSPNMIWKCVYLHGNFRKCLAAITGFKK